MKRKKPYYPPWRRPLGTKKKAVQLAAAGLLTEEQACEKSKICKRLETHYQGQALHDTSRVNNAAVSDDP